MYLLAWFGSRWVLLMLVSRNDSIIWIFTEIYIYIYRVVVPHFARLLHPLTIYDSSRCHVMVLANASIIKGG